MIESKRTKSKKKKSVVIDFIKAVSEKQRSNLKGYRIGQALR
jgi:hypothetical protein